jgi:hypothetical protein
MLDSLYNLFLGCHHRRTSFPMSPSVKPGAPHEDMYVVCLDCGKRFHYQWDLMRIGEPMEQSNAKPAVPKRSRLRYAAVASALPILWFIGKAALGRKRAKSEQEQKLEPKP